MLEDLMTARQDLDHPARLELEVPPFGDQLQRGRAPDAPPIEPLVRAKTLLARTDQPAIGRVLRELAKAHATPADVVVRPSAELLERLDR
jgi:hypothetical protein